MVIAIGTIIGAGKHSPCVMERIVMGAPPGVRMVHLMPCTKGLRMTGLTLHIESGVTSRRKRDRVRYHTASDVLRCIDDATKDQLKHHASLDSKLISERLQALDRQWDADRAIAAEAST